MDSINYLPLKTILSSKQNQYYIYKVLGQGGFGIVYKAIDRNNQKVAIKEYFPGSLVSRSRDFYTVTVKEPGQESKEYFRKGVRRFYEEAATMQRFKNDPNIVDVKDFFQANGTAYIVMEFVQGRTFLQILRAQPNERLSLADVVVNIEPVIKALDRIHTTPWVDNNGKKHSGIVHRDISPDNIMFASNGAVKLMDFGAARTVSMQGEFQLTGIVKPGYAPVEQFIGSGKAGAQGPWTDVYALAATIYRAITGVVPQDSRQRQAHDDLKLPSAFGIPITGRQEQILLKGLALDYQYRYQTVKDFYKDLKDSMLDSVPDPVPPVPDPIPPVPPDPVPKVYWVIAIFVILIVLYMLIGTVKAQNQYQTQRQELQEIQSQLEEYKSVDENYGKASDSYFAVNPILLLQANGDEGKMIFCWSGSRNELKVTSSDSKYLDCDLEEHEGGLYQLIVTPKNKRGPYRIHFANTKNQDNFDCWVIVM